jgi:sulfur-oxidizing protein SoxY
MIGGRRDLRSWQAKIPPSPPLPKGGSAQRKGISLLTSCSRRIFLVSLLGSALLPLLKAQPSSAAIPDKLLLLIREAAGGVTPKTGRVKLTLPPLAESGNSVPLKIQIESPMTATNYVKSIHIFSEKNPRPMIARFYLGPRSGKAEVNTRIRLAGTQQVVAVAVMSDGSSWLGAAEVVVTAGACIDEK